MSPITSNDKQLFHVAIARLEARMEKLEEDLREMREVDAANTTGRFEVMKAERDDALAKLDRRSERDAANRQAVIGQIIAGTVLLLLGALIGWLANGSW